jgi:hypothetical protein
MRQLARAGAVCFVLAIAAASAPSDRANAITESVPPVAAPAAVTTDHAIVDGRYVGCDTGYGDRSNTSASLVISE